jgi:hypothetical protein
MADAEAQVRKAHKSSAGTNRLANAARLSALEKNLGVPIKRHKNVDDIGFKENQPDNTTKDEIIPLGSGF